jgi:hypothetical protein
MACEVLVDDAPMPVIVKARFVTLTWLADDRDPLNGALA